MFRRNLYLTAVVCLASALAFGCGLFQTSGKKKEGPIVIQGGTVSPTLGVGFDATYDNELDSVIPGYKIVTVAYKNNSMNIIQMDPLNDRWYVVDKKGRKLRAKINLRRDDPDTWAKLPKRLRMLIEYPLMIPVGATVTIDLLVNHDNDLVAFKEVDFKPAGTKREFRIIPRE